jgi:dTDP-4-dehydrorhamnose reductase
MRVLITGASGMLGAALVHQLKNEYNVFATGNSYFKEQPHQYLKFDLSSNDYHELIEWSNPDIIVHCGALTNGNLCKEKPELALNVNGLTIERLIKATKPNVKVIYISTDAVFPSEVHMAKETDCSRPENVYGKSKELGEFFLLNSNKQFSIIRTTIVGFNLNKEKNGFVEWIINSSKDKEKIGLFNDVIFTPISIYDLISEIEFLIKENQINSEIIHIAGNESCSKYEFGTMLLKAIGLSPNNIKPSSILEFKDRAKRCADQTLNTTFYNEKYNRKLPTLQQTIHTLKEKYYELN